LRIDQVAGQLDAFVRKQRGPAATVEGLRVMEGGHAGLTFGFDLCDADTHARRGFVLKLAPPGVRRSGNTDVYRQAPLLRALHAAGVAVPDVPWAGEGTEDFGVPFVMMERLPGEPFFIWAPDASYDLSDAAVAPLWTQTIDALATLHRFDWRRLLANWEAPRSLRDEIERWRPILAKAPEPGWIAQGEALCQRLLATRPDGEPLGLIHGDMQPGNALFDQGRLTGFIDWELAGIGSRRLDAGWLMLAADAASWPADWRPVCPLTPQQIAVRYAERMGEPVGDLPWYQALAGWRLGAITCLNVHLHRNGRRPDAVWERFAAAVSPMFARAQRILDDDLAIPAGGSR
jgi:aminoglycoside phosphotransferase (APT) family kinase protein